MGVNEQERLIAFMDAGNAVYMSGVNVATDHNGTEFWNRFGASYQSVSEEIPSLLGESGTFADGIHFEYLNESDAGRNNDVIGEDGGEIIFRSEDSLGRVVVNSTDTYRTIVSSVLLGAIPDQAGIARKENVMMLYLSHLLDINEPKFWSSEGNIVFPDVVPGGTVERTFYVQNTGQSELTLSNINIYGDGFTISENDEVVLGYGEYQAYIVTLNPMDEGTYSGYISYTTNEPGNETVMIGLIGNSIGVPVMQLSHDGFEVQLEENGSTTETMTISNIGGGYLDYHLDLLPENDIEYLWKDSNMPDGPEFIWNDISAIGTNLELGGLDSYVTIELPFPFIFYGQEKNEMKVSTNGYLTFGIDGTDYSNDIIPGSLEPDDIIAAFWDDLRSTGESDAYSWFDEENGIFVIQYTNWQVNMSGGEGEMNFQIHLHANGDIYFYYENMDGRLTSATVGVENSDHTAGTLVVYNEEYLENNLAVKLSHNESWISLNSYFGTVPFGQSTEINLNFDASELESGTYFTNLVVRSNEVESVSVEIPLQLVVGSTSGNNLEVPGFASLNQNYPNPFNPSTSISFELKSTGNVQLDIYNTKGEKVKTLLNETLSEGSYNVNWDGKDNRGDFVSSGIYFYKMKSGRYTNTKKMILMK